MLLETITIVGKKGRLIINLKDLADWKAKGYKLESEVEEDLTQDVQSEEEPKSKKFNKKG